MTKAVLETRAAFVVRMMRFLFGSLYGYLAELLHQLRNLERGFAGTRAGRLVAFLDLCSGVGCEYLELGVDLFYSLFHNLKTVFFGFVIIAKI